MALAGCSDIPSDTFEIELTTDQAPQRVELWSQRGRGKDRSERRLYALQFPQEYFAYRDNHDSTRQSLIGLLLENPSLQPLARIIAAERHIQEPLSVPKFKEGALKKLAFSDYRHRQILLTLSGDLPIVSLPIDEARARYAQQYDHVGPSQGIDFYRVRHPRGYPDRGLPELEAFNIIESTLTYHCSAGVEGCSVSFPYRGATAQFTLRREDLGASLALTRRIKQLLEAHAV